MKKGKKNITVRGGGNFKRGRKYWENFTKYGVDVIE
jgi:hypothetical protein